MVVLIIIFVSVLLFVFVVLPFVLRIVTAFIEGMSEGRASQSGHSEKLKSKNVAVVLAAFLGFWSWLYVFEQENRWKFRLNLCLTVVTLGIWGIGAWIWAIIDMSRKPISYFENYGKQALQKSD